MEALYQEFQAPTKVNPDEISEETVAQRLYTAGQPDVDLMIRTSGEMRLSNFLLWQCAYAEFAHQQQRSFLYIRQRHCLPLR